MKLILRIDDVGRLEGDGPEEGSDEDLRFFARWRQEAGLVGLPVYYGVVPAWISETGQYWIVSNLEGAEQVAIHGWDHIEPPTATQMQVARVLFNGAEAYIPPYNRYNLQTMFNWGKVGGRYFLGGFRGEHHYFPLYPYLLGAQEGAPQPVVHLAADARLYGHAGHLIGRLGAVEEYVQRNKITYPIVMTLHVPWEPEPKAVARLVEKIKGNLVSLQAADEWIQQEG